MTSQTENVNIYSSREMICPGSLKREIPINEKINDFVIQSRETIRNILDKKDKRFLFVVGPCSIHNIEEAKNYASQLKNISVKLKNIFIVMKVCFESPRINIGWKGLIHDPDLNNSFDVNKGLYLARDLLIYINSIGLPCGCEFLDVFTPQYIGDLISWGAIDATTTESQPHIQMVSGLSMPVGFKNNLSGNLNIPCDSILSASSYQSFIGINDYGKASIFVTNGNKYGHIILGGDEYGGNYKQSFIIRTQELLTEYNLPINIMIDCSQGKFGNNYKNQKYVLNHVMMTRVENRPDITGFMLDSNINEGKQILNANTNLRYGISITDGCISLKQTEDILLSIDDFISLIVKK